MVSGSDSLGRGVAIFFGRVLEAKETPYIQLYIYIHIANDYEPFCVHVMDDIAQQWIVVVHFSSTMVHPHQ